MSTNEANNKEKRVKVSPQVLAKYQEIKLLLRKRGMSEFSFQDFLDCVFTKTPEKTFQEIIEEHTPEEYRIKEAMEDPALRFELLRLIDKKKGKQTGKETFL